MQLQCQFLVLRDTKPFPLLYHHHNFLSEGLPALISKNLDEIRLARLVLESPVFLEVEALKAWGTAEIARPY